MTCKSSIVSAIRTVINTQGQKIFRVRGMPTFEQEWISPILEVYKKRKITDTYTVILGFNPIGQALCRQLYEETHFETLLVFNSPAFSTLNRYPIDVKPPVVPIQGMVSDDLMLIFGDVFVKEYEWVPDLLFYLRGNVPTRFVIALMTHEGHTVGQVLTKRGDRLLKRMNVPLGRSDFYDGLTAPLLSLGTVAGLDPVVLFVEGAPEAEVILQVEGVSVSQDEIQRARVLLEKGLDLGSMG
ncbi:MAG: hypothetical protein ACW97A_04510 [Candidatus Thorarchaeota archaeon]|jgi:hypothetical protein